MEYFAGIDIGSTAIKIAIVDDKGELAGHRVSASGSMESHARKPTVMKGRFTTSAKSAPSWPLWSSTT